MPSQNDIDAQQTLLAAHRQTLDILLEQQALLGIAFAPPGLRNGIRIARDEIQRIKDILRGWGVVIEDLPNDADPPKEDYLDDSEGRGTVQSIPPATVRNVITEGGDYAEGDIDKRQGIFLNHSTATDSVVVGINQGTINTTLQVNSQSIFSLQESHSRQLEQIIQRLLSQATQTSLPDLSTVTAVPSLDALPLAPETYVQRDTLIQQFEQALSLCTWLALVDSSGKGKTQIARDISILRPSENVLWISLGERDLAVSRAHLRQQLIRWLIQLTGDQALWVEYTSGYLHLSKIAERIARTMGSAGGIAVVDNLPDPVHSQPLYEDLCHIASLFAHHNVKLLTTSQRRPPPFVELQLGLMVSVAALVPFSSADIFTFLEHAQAPEHIRHETIVSLILADTKGSPWLVGAHVLWLKQRQWNVSKEELSAILAGKPGESVREFVRRQMLQLLEPRSREVLYRLSLIQFEFDKPLAANIAAVAPAIERVGEFIDELVGPWLDQKQDTTYEVSPLIKESGQHALDAALQKNIHRAIADYIVAQRVINVSEAYKLITHLSLSHDHDRLAVILIQILHEALTQTQAKQVLWMTHIMTGSVPWPDEMGSNLRIMLRAAQVHARVVAGEDATDLDNELELLMSQAGPENVVAVFVACLTTGPMLEDMPPLISLERTIRALRLYREHHFLPKDVLPSTIDEVIVFPLMHLKTPEQLRATLTILRNMTEVERRKLFDTELAIEILPAVIDKTTWSYESDKNPSERKWDAIFTLLDEVQATGNLAGAELLLCAHARVRAVIFADYLDNVDAAIAELEQAPPPAKKPLAFLLHYTAGCILFEAKRDVEALVWFDKAPSIEPNIFAFYNFDAKSRQAVLRGQLGQWAIARGHCIEALQTSGFHAKHFFYHRLEMFGELAWIHWSSGNRRKAVAALYGLVAGLALQEDTTNARFKEVFNKAGHSLGWFLGRVTFGEIPLQTLTGDEYIPIHAGFYARSRPAMSTHSPKFGFSKSALLAQLGMFASKLGFHSIALHTYRLAITYTRDNDQYWLFGIGDIDYAGLIARFGRPEEALSEGLHAIKVFAAIQRKYTNGDHTLEAILDSQESWQSLNSEERRREERKLLYIVFGPIFAEVLGTYQFHPNAFERIVMLDQALKHQQDVLADREFWQDVSSL